MNTPPEAPPHLGNTEATYWQQGWESGFEACQRHANEMARFVQYIRDNEPLYARNVDLAIAAKLWTTMKDPPVVGYLFRFHTEDSLKGKPNPRPWIFYQGEPTPALLKGGEVRLLVDKS